MHRSDRKDIEDVREGNGPHVVEADVALDELGELDCVAWRESEGASLRVSH